MKFEDAPDLEQKKDPVISRPLDVPRLTVWKTEWTDGRPDNYDITLFSIKRILVDNAGVLGEKHGFVKHMAVIGELDGKELKFEIALFSNDQDALRFQRATTKETWRGEKE